MFKFIIVGIIRRIFRLPFIIYYKLEYFLYGKWIFNKHNVFISNAPEKDKIRIYACYQPKAIKNNTKEFLQDVFDQGYEIWFIAPHKINQDDRDELCNIVKRFIERKNVGRDFGSYKFGIKMLQQTGRLQKIDSLIICNDSVTYIKDMAKEFWEKLNLTTAAWVGVLESFINNYHASSWFLLFRKPMVSSPYFIKFWNKYRPYSYRTYAIDKGELLLSKLCLEKEFCEILYSSVDLETSLKKLKTEEILARYEKVKDSYFKNKVTEIIKLSKIIKDNNEKKQFIKNEFIKVLIFSITRSNPAHTFSRILIEDLHMPFLKNDICYRGKLDFAEVISFCNLNGKSFDEFKRMIALIGSSPVCIEKPWEWVKFFTCLK